MKRVTINTERAIGVLTTVAALAGLNATLAHGDGSMDHYTVKDKKNNCYFTAGMGDERDAYGGTILEAYTSAGADRIAFENCRTKRGAGRVSVQIHCPTTGTSSANMIASSYTAVAKNVSVEDSSCYARFRYNPTVLASGWGTEYRSYWYPGLGWQDPVES